MTEEEFNNLLINRTTEHIEQNIDKYIQMVAVWISKILLADTKNDITFEFDPQWDRSGTIYKTEKQFNIDDYSTLDSFITNEYNGSSRPSYLSGMGTFHDYYLSELDELTDEWVLLQLTEIIALLLQENNRLILEFARLNDLDNNNKSTNQLATEISQLVYSDGFIGDFLVVDAPIELKESIGNMAIKFLFKFGKHEAKVELRQEENDRQKRMKEEKNKKVKVEKCWNKICLLHKVKYQKYMPEKVEKNYFNKYVYPILKAEFRDNKNAADIQLIGKFLSFKFSNSVAVILSTYKC
ncbi:hypothetical protein F9U64_18555 [Gracilibacillus oryzae]|uniref:Uncharacterized protein n=1 Tax=Gracilibacillus oryzae TaxID=1672701 RepID=A0A7C8GR21_9BACI|nr:hypothetical protein [Gracilibacillus oryzae]KAB8127096.1 hypothetical protein F9U64_18555 [Gracilibacillus oryzae]